MLRRRKTNAAITVLLALVLVKGIILSFTIPPWQHYDEPGHFEYIRYLLLEKRLPHRSSGNQVIRREIIASMEEQHFGAYQRGWHSPSLLDSNLVVPLTQFSHPPLYYFLCSLLIYPLARQNLITQLYVLRLASVALNLLTVWVAFRTAKELFPGNAWTQIAVPLFMSLLPAYMDIMSAVNNDVLANALFSLLIYIAVRVLKSGVSLSRLSAMGTVLVLALFTKRTTIISLLTPALLFMFWIQRRYGNRACVIVTSAALALGALAAVSLTYAWDELPDWVSTYVRVNWPEFWRSVWDWRRTMPFYQIAARIIFEGFWAHFSWGDRAFAGWVYTLLSMLSVLAFAGVIWGLLRPDKRWSVCTAQWQRQAIVFLLIMTWLIGIITFLRIHPLPVSGQPVYIPRARYVYVAIVPIAVLLVFGLERFIAYAGVRARFIRLGLVWAYLMMDWAFFIHLISYYYAS